MEQIVEEKFEPSDMDLKQIAEYNAKFFYEKFNKPVMVDDTGVFFKAYDNFPGIVYIFYRNEDKSIETAIIRRLHQKFKAEPGLEEYPAHLHIDILPEGQGFGLGWKLMKIFFDKLRELKVKGLHLGVGKKNQNAVKFYKHIGFKVFKEYENHLILIFDL